MSQTHSGSKIWLESAQVVKVFQYTLILPTTRAADRDDYVFRRVANINRDLWLRRNSGGDYCKFNDLSQRSGNATAVRQHRHRHIPAETEFHAMKTSAMDKRQNPLQAVIERTQSKMCWRNFDLFGLAKFISWEIPLESNCGHRLIRSGSRLKKHLRLIDSSGFPASARGPSLAVHGLDGCLKVLEIPWLYDHVIDQPTSDEAFEPIIVDESGGQYACLVRPAMRDLT